jgi:hypothetical protein
MTEAEPKKKKKATRGTSNKNVTGSSSDRRARKMWLLREFGDGVVAMCAFGCGTELTFDTLTVDRFPIPGYLGGRYVHGNIRISCAPCNMSEGGRAGAARRKEKSVSHTSQGASY